MLGNNFRKKRGICARCEHRMHDSATSYPEDPQEFVAVSTLPDPNVRWHLPRIGSSLRDTEEGRHGRPQEGHLHGRCNMTTTITRCADYIIYKTAEDGRALNLLKLQKLAYYVQAWHLAINRAPLFAGSFEAWVHGPVNRELYDRFRDSHELYGAVTIEDVTPGFKPKMIDAADREFIDSVL